MQKKSKLWQAFLAVSLSALAVPTFAQGQSGTPGSPSTGSGVHSGSGSTEASGTKGSMGSAGPESGSPAGGGSMEESSETSGTTESSGTKGSTGSPSTRSTPPSSSAGMGASEQVGRAMGDQATTEADRALNQRIRQSLSADSSLGTTAEKVHLTTENGEVTLQGTVATEKEKADIAAKVQQISGVKKVDNQLQMAPGVGGTSGGSMGAPTSESKGSPAGGSTGATTRGSMESSGSTTNR